MRYIAASALLAMIIVAGCGSSSTGPSDPTDYMPIAVGNQWNYSADGYGTFTVTADTVTITGNVVRKVTGETTHQEGFQLYQAEDVMTMTMTFPDTSITQVDTTVTYVHKTDTEIRIYDDTTTTDYELFLMLPLTVGDTWIPYSDSTSTSTTREVLTLTASVTVPAGSYNGCAQIQDTDSEQPGTYFDMFLARGTGIVSYVSHIVETDGTFHVEFDLTSSTVN